MRKALVLMVVTSSMVALGQSSSQRPVPVQPVQEMSFEDDLISGDLSRPDVEYFTPGVRTPHPRLIKVREAFKEKVMESASAL
jgi:hypothetical protein